MTSSTDKRLAAIKAKFEQINNQGSGNSEDFIAKFLKIEEGTTPVRILPGPTDADPFYSETSLHRVTGADGILQNFQCRKIQGQPCPLCEAVDKLWKKHSSLNLPRGEKSPYGDMATAIKSRSRFYMNVLNRNTNEVKILSVGVVLFRKILAGFCDEDFGDITDPKNGFDFKIVMAMEGKWPKYDQSAFRPKSTPLAENKKQEQEILSQIHDLTELVSIPEYEAVRNVAMELLAPLNLTVVNLYPKQEKQSEEVSEVDTYLQGLKEAAQDEA